MPAKTMLIEAIRQRPASCERTSSATSSWDVRANRCDCAGPVPRVLPSWTPEIDRPSSTWVCRSAIRRCRSPVTSRRTSATLRVSHTAGGRTTRDSSDRRQLSAPMATAVPTTVVALEARLVAVLVTTDCMEPMSLVSRDCTSPPRVRVKKPSDWRCRWVKTDVRSPCMTRWPTVVEIQVCTTPSRAVAAATATMPATAQASSRTSACGSASSMTVRTRKGVARAISELVTISAITVPTCRRCGRKSASTRRRGTGERSSWLRSAGSVRVPGRGMHVPLSVGVDAEVTSR